MGLRLEDRADAWGCGAARPRADRRRQHPPEPRTPHLEEQDGGAAGSPRLAVGDNEGLRIERVHDADAVHDSHDQTTQPLPIAVLLAVAALILAQTTPFSAAAGDPPLCDPDTQRFTTTSADTGAPQDPQRARNAMQWLRSMMDPPRDLGGGDGIRLSGGHGYRDSGEVSGDFTLDEPGRHPLVSEHRVECRWPRLDPQRLPGTGLRHCSGGREGSRQSLAAHRPGL